MMQIAVSLPWPKRGLSPNARLHWAAKAKLTSRAKGDAFMLARAARPKDWPDAIDRAHVAIAVCPPDRRHRDLDNILASLKAALDGIASAARCDDSRWSLSIDMREPVKGGAVQITIAPEKPCQTRGLPCNASN
jgi:crossover junction endodeoxyribonuclease RusA